jgi:hypothetical protein
MTANVLPAWLTELTTAHRGFILNRPDGGVLVSDRTGRYVVSIDLPTLPEEQVETARSELRECLAIAEAHTEDERITFELHTTVEAIHRSPEVRNSLPQLMEGLLELGQVDLCLSFSRPPENWYLVTHLLVLLLTRHPPLLGHIQMNGPFGPLEERLKELLSLHAIALGITAGWSPAGPVRFDPAVVRDLARFGFRTPLSFYVTAANLPEAAAAVAAGLKANEHSGFALPAAFYHPDYDPSRHEPPPTAAEYALLLAQAYRDFPHYDETFFPVSDVVSSFAHGGWREQAAVPAIVRMLLSPQRGIGSFRHIPAFATAWVGWPAVKALSPAELAQRLVGIQRSTFAQAGARICQGCPWWHVCGGVDHAGPRYPAAEQIRLAACDFRKDFYDGLTRLRAEIIPLKCPAPAPTPPPPAAAATEAVAAGGVG